jgi:heme oxygenase
MTLLEIQMSLYGRNLTDVLLTGFIDRNDDPLRFYALLQTVYFEFSDFLLDISTLGDSGRIRLELVASLRHNVELDDDMVFATTSIRQQILRDPDGQNVLAALRFWNVSEDAGIVVCSAARLDLANGQNIFVDPSNYFVIQLGGCELEETWASRKDR